MAARAHNGRLKSLEELLRMQRASGPARCDHCGHAPGAAHDHDDLTVAQMRKRLAVLEARLAKLEDWICGVS